MVNYKDFTSISTSERINTLKAYELTPVSSYINLKDRIKINVTTGTTDTNA